MSYDKVPEEEEEETSFLPVGVDELVDALSEMADEAKAVEFRHMVDGLRVVVGTYYDAISQRIRASIDSGMATQEARNAFLADILRLLASAQYSFLEEDTFDDAGDGQYSFKFPNTVEWSKIDSQPLTEYHKRRTHEVSPSVPAPPYKADALPEFAGKLLILTRGRGKVSSTEYFVDEKLNLMCEVAYAKMKAAVGLGKKSSVPPQGGGGGGGGGGRRPSKTLEEACKGRVSLVGLCKESGVLNNLFKKLTIQEPTFENAIIVYWPEPGAEAGTEVHMSKDVPEKARKKGSSTLRKRKGKEEAAVAAPAQRPGVVVSSYAHIPFGDLEGAFPFKEVFLRPFDLFQVGIYAVMGLLVVWATLESIFSEDQQDSGAFMLLQLLLVEVCRQGSVLFTYYTNLKVAYMREVHQWEQRHNHATGMAVVSQLVDDVKAQELKELVVAYFLLWVHGPSTSAEVDKRAEDFLREKFSLDLNFDVADAIQKLLCLKLIAKDSQGRYLITLTPAEWTKEVPTAHITALKLKAET